MSEDRHDSEVCQWHKDMIQKLDHAITGLTTMTAAIPVQLKAFSDEVRNLRIDLLDRTSKLFRYHDEVLDRLHQVEVDVKLLKEQKMPPRIFKLESWRAYVLGGLAVLALLANLGLTVWSILK